MPSVRLSQRTTVLLMVVFPGVLWVIVALMAYDAWFGAPVPGTPAEQGRLGAFLFSLIAVGLSYAGTRLKVVQLEPGGLRIAGPLRSELVPFDLLQEVRTVRFGRGHALALRFARPTQWGEEVYFLPRYSLANATSAERGALVAGQAAAARSAPLTKLLRYWAEPSGADPRERMEMLQRRMRGDDG